jgi:hypothetical protein
MSAENTEYRPRCKYLCGKSLAVFGEDYLSDPDVQDGTAEFCCMCTSGSQGPDGDVADPQECCNPERSCYQAF